MKSNTEKQRKICFALQELEIGKGFRNTDYKNPQSTKIQQSPWLKQYINFNKQKRTEAKNAFEEDYFLQIDE